MDAAIRPPLIMPRLWRPRERKLEVARMTPVGAGRAAILKRKAGDFPTVMGRRDYTGTGSASAHSVLLPEGTTVGERLLIVVSTTEDLFASTVASTGGTKPFASLHREILVSGASSQIEVFHRVVDGTEGYDGTGDTVSVGWGGAESSDIVARVWRLRGSGVPQVAGAASPSTSTSPKPPNLAPSGGLLKYLWIAAALFDGGDRTVSDTPDNYTDTSFLRNGTSSSDIAQVTAERLLEAASEDPTTWTFTGAQEWAALTIAVPPA